VAQDPIKLKRRPCLLALALLSVFALAGTTTPPRELWEIKLTGEGGIQRFNRSGNGIWITQEGLVFISADRVLIYQVNRTPKRTVLAQRDPSGGTGSFLLEARIFDARTGKEIKRMQFLTASDYSSILPAHDGNFIVRTGSLLTLFSPNFDVLSSRELPLEKLAPLDYWEVGATPSGKQIALVHQQLYSDPDSRSDDDEPGQFKSNADVEIADADTLKTTQQLHLSYYLPIWAVQDGFLLITTPNKLPKNSEFGTLDFQGRWTPLRPGWAQGQPGCSYKMDLLEHELMVARGCGGLVVFSQAGDKLFQLPLRSWEMFASVAGADQYLALETNEYVVPADRPPSWQPSGIQVYDMRSHERIAFAKIKKPNVRYALSPEGLLAVLDGDELKLYQPN